MKKNKNKFHKYSKVLSEIGDISNKIKGTKKQAVKLWSKINMMSHKEMNIDCKNALRELQQRLYANIIGSLRDSDLQLQFIDDNILERLCK